MKKSLIIALALMLVLAFASSAMAAQALSITVPGAAYTYDDNAVKQFLPTEKTFTVDGYAYYPYEIYLPNEAAPGSYRIHSSYAKNTDACASCHATHTAVGNSLLQWYTVYETCMACHDGTVSTTYDVANGTFGTDGIAAGGAFGDDASMSASNHNVTGAMSISAAPGGSTVAKTFDAEDPTKALNWEIEFGCQSCHTPHGLGGNARILHPDANNAASDRAAAQGYLTNGIVATNTVGVLVAGQNTGFKLTEATAADQVYNAYYFLNEYPYNKNTKVGIDGDVFDGGYGANFTVDNSAGYTKINLVGARIAQANAATLVVVYGVPSMKVTMDIKNYLLGSSETVEHVAGMNVFCGACHTDYNTASVAAATYNAKNGNFEGSGEKLTGVNSSAHRHQVGFQWEGPAPAGLKFETGQLGAGNGKKGMECLTCHVAHGVNEDYWTITLTQAGQAWDSLGLSLKELAGSSALKRMPNMGTCEACHAKGAGNAGYSANTTGVVGVIGSGAGVAQGLSINWFKDAAFNSLGLGAAAYDSVAAYGLKPYYDGTQAGTIAPNNVIGAIYEPSSPTAKKDAFRNGRAAAITFSTPTTRNYFFKPGVAGSTYFFNSAISYVGNAACEKCHGDYMKGYTESHGNSFKSAADADLATKIADTYTKAHTLSVGTSLGTEDVNGSVYEFYVKALDTIGLKIPGGADLMSYTISQSGSDYIFDTNNNISYNISANAKYLFMNHYIVAARGATMTDLDAAGTAGTVTAQAYQYARFAQWMPDVELVIPYLNRTTAAADKASMAAWISANAKVDAADGCYSCHSPQLEYGKGDLGISCETCHGPGALHAAAPTTTNIFSAKPTTRESVGTIDSYQLDRLCLMCHNAQSEITTSYAHNRIFTPPTTKYSGHYSGSRSCVTCHDIHNEDTGFLKENKEALCYGCHDVQLDVTKFFETAYPVGTFVTTSGDFNGMLYVKSTDDGSIKAGATATRASHVFMKKYRYIK